MLCTHVILSVSLCAPAHYRIVRSASASIQTLVSHTVYLVTEWVDSLCTNHRNVHSHNLSCTTLDALCNQFNLSFVACASQYPIMSPIPPHTPSYPPYLPIPPHVPHTSRYPLISPIPPHTPSYPPYLPIPPHIPHTS